MLTHREKIMWSDKDSPFEAWRKENLQNMAVSRDILILIARAFEGGQLSERRRIFDACEAQLKATAHWGKGDNDAVL